LKPPKNFGQSKSLVDLSTMPPRSIARARRWQDEAGF